MYKVYRNGSLIADGLTEKEADTLMAEQRKFDAKNGPAWGYEVGRYHKVRDKRRR